MNISAYLDRIAYTGSLAPTAETLRGLHRAHMLMVPFENLDIALGRTIICDEQLILRKIVEQHRGGFCYELNGAFAALLREIGFKVTLLSARVARQDGSRGPEFDHLTLKVDLDEPWLADVGFGDSFLEPLRLKTDFEQRQDGRKFRLVEERGSLYLEMADPEDWKRQYAFTLTAHRLGDFAGMCRYHQTSPESSFTQKRICSRATPDGRITITGGKLIITTNGKKEESALDSDPAWREALSEYFGIVL